MPKSTLTRTIALAAKRTIDVVGAATGLVVLAPVLGASALAIYATMGRPVFFKQERPGLHAKPFAMRKFRTMRPTAAGEVYFRTDAKRLTSLGRFLRKTSLDELPELWHVLTGEMSLVGPRPLLMEYLPKYSVEHRRRHDVRPGITGWAQVNGRQLSTFSKRLEHDVWYVKNWSLGLDLKILAMTARDLVHSEGNLPGQTIEEVDDLGFAPGIKSEPFAANAPQPAPNGINGTSSLGKARHNAL